MDVKKEILNREKEESGKEVIFMCKVSIIMLSYNVARYIRECLESVVNQTLRDIEIICIDAGSTDGTREILTEYASLMKNRNWR